MFRWIAKSLSLTGVTLAVTSVYAEIPLAHDNSSRVTTSAHATQHYKDQGNEKSAIDAESDPLRTDESVNNAQPQIKQNADIDADAVAGKTGSASDNEPTPKSKTPVPIPADPSRSNLHWQSLLPGMMK